MAGQESRGEYVEQGAQRQTSAASHTPGPWTVAEGETPWTLGDAQTALENGEPFGETMCLFPVVGGEPGFEGTIALMPYEGASGAARIAELEANARLIAAAPDLLAALIRARECIEDAVGESDGWPIFDEIDAAIAKARGQ